MRPTSLLATAKHFAAYGAAEGGRDYNVAAIGERQMWEVYLPPFEAAVRAGVGSLMASFNEIDGTPAHASHWLLTDVLRDRWKFDGLVVSDWDGVDEVQGCSKDKCAQAVNAGDDAVLLAASDAGKVVGAIDEAVARGVPVFPAKM